LLLVGLAYGGLQNLTLTHAFAIAGEPARQSVSIAWNLSFDAGTGLGAFVVGAIATATSYSVAFGVLALAAVLTGGGWAWPGLARRGLPGRESVPSWSQPGSRTDPAPGWPRPVPGPARRRQHPRRSRRTGCDLPQPDLVQQTTAMSVIALGAA
jgi:hypothetical protein